MKTLISFILALALAVSANAASISPAAEKTLSEMLDPSGKIYMWNTNKHAVPPLAPAGMSRIYLDSTDLTMKMSINGGAYSDILTGTAGVLSPSHGGTGTSTVFTAGSVVFSGASGIYTQDNATFFYDNATDSLGLGTPTPSRHLHLYTASDAVSMFKIEVAGTTLNPVIELQDSTSAQTRTGAFNFLNGAGAAVGQISYGFSTNSLGFRTNSAMRWSMDSSGNFLASTDNSWDIGATGATRPRTGYFGTSVISPILATGIDTGTIQLGTSSDIILTHDAAAQLGIRNGATGQRLNIYGQYTSGSNYERVSIGWNVSNGWFSIQSETDGSNGTARALSFATGNTTRWQFNTSGHFLAILDNTYDIGAVGATRPRTIYAGTSIITASLTDSALTSGRVTFAGASGILSDDSDMTFSGSTLTVTNLAGTTMTGNLLFTDNTLDIGASGATRPRTLYAGTSVISPQVQTYVPVHDVISQTAPPSVLSTQTFDLTNGSTTTGVMFEFDVRVKAADFQFIFGTDTSNEYRVTFESDTDFTIRKVIAGVSSIITSSSSAWTNNVDSLHCLVTIVSDSITWTISKLDGTRITLTGAVDTGSLPLTSSMKIAFANTQHIYNFRFHQSVQVPIFGDTNYYDYQNARLGLGTRSPTNALSLAGTGARKIWMERHTTANTAGNSLTIQAGSATSAATNKDGGALGLAAGIPTGTGRSQIRLKGHTTSLASGTTDGTEVDRLVVNGYKALSDNSPVALFTTTVASNAVAAGVIRYAIEVFDGTELQVEEGQAFYHITNKGGVIANNEFTVNSQQALTSGTLSVTFAISAAATASVSVNANSSLTPSAGYPRISYTLESFLDSTISLN